MRFDEINILGEFKMRGLVGSENQFLGLSGGALAWLDPIPAVSGFDIYGTNYVFCNSVTYSATVSGENLLAAYASASNLTVSSTNRGAVLISPGVYDFDTQSLGLSLSFIDLIGVTPVASSITLKASNSPNTLVYYEGVDSGLYNVGLAGGTVLGVLGSASTYLRWGNVEVSGDSMYNGANYSFENLNGEFADIKMYDNSRFGVASVGINGTFKNMIVGDNTEFMVVPNPGTINATVSNIKIGNIDNCFRAVGGLNGTYKNIEIESVANSAFISSSILNSYFENIKIINPSGEFFSGQTSNIELNNFEASGISDMFFTNAAGLTVDGIFRNIKIGSVLNNFFYNELDAITGTFSNIEIENVGLSAFESTGINGNFENIHFGTVGGNIFSSAGQLVGTFSDISVDLGTDGTSIFSAGDYMNISVDNFILKNMTDQGDNNTEIFTTKSNELIGNFTNITIGTSSAGKVFSNTQEISGNFKNIRLQNHGEIFTGARVQGIFQDIVAGTISSSAFSTSNGTLAGEFRDIKLGGADIAFYSGFLKGDVEGDPNQFGTNLVGTFSNIEVGYTYDGLFGGSGITASFNKIKVGRVYPISSGAFKRRAIFRSFSTQVNLLKISDVYIGELSESFLEGQIQTHAIIDNVTIDLVSATESKIIWCQFATVSNFFVNNTAPNVASNNYFNIANIKGSFRNLYLGSASNVFRFNSVPNDSNLLVDNLNVLGPICSEGFPFRGKISNSYINAINSGSAAIFLATGSVIDRTKLISSTFSITSSGNITSKITYTLANQDFRNTITNIITDNKNIISSAIQPGGKI